MKLRFFALLLTLALLFGGCAREPEEYRDTVFFGMDTYITVRLAKAGLTDDYLDIVAAECERIVTELEAVLSAHDPDSELYALNESDAESVEISDTLEAVLLAAYHISEQTDGAYDCTTGGLANLWNITGGGPVPAQADIDTVLAHVGYENITLDETRNTVMRSDTDAQIDLGGIGKGAAADELVRYLETTDIPYGIVSVGGNIGVFGDKPGGEAYQIGIRDPDDPNGVLGYLMIEDGFVAVSGDYERYFEENGVRYHHIFDPSDGYPADSGLRSVAVHAKNGAGADALSTALFVMGTDAAMELFENVAGFEAVLILNDGTVETTGPVPLELAEP